MRHARQVPVVGARQCGSFGWKHDVVAVPKEAREPSKSFCRFGCGQFRKPRTALSHLSPIGRQRIACQPGSAMWGSHRDHAMHARICAESPQPSTCGQAPHAVCDHHRRQTCCGVQASDRSVDGRNVILDRTEHWLQIDGDKRDAGRPKPAHPGRPQTSIAHEAVYQDHAASDFALNCVGLIRHRIRCKWLTPTEDTQATQDLAPPSPHRQHPARRRSQH